MHIPSAFWTASLQYLPRRDKARVARTSRGIRTAISSRLAWSTRDWCLNLMFGMHVTKCDWNAAERLFVELDTPADFAAFSAVLALERCIWSAGMSIVLVSKALRMILPFQRTNKACGFIAVTLKRWQARQVTRGVSPLVAGLDQVDKGLTTSDIRDIYNDSLLMCTATMHSNVTPEIRQQIVARGIACDYLPEDKKLEYDHPFSFLSDKHQDVKATCLRFAAQGFVPAILRLAMQFEMGEYQVKLLHLGSPTFELWLAGKMYNEGHLSRQGLVNRAEFLADRGNVVAFVVLAKDALARGDTAMYLKLTRYLKNNHVAVYDWHPFAKLKF